MCLCIFVTGPIPHLLYVQTTSGQDVAEGPVNEKDNNNPHTNIQDSLFGCVLPGVPVFPILQLLISALVFPKDNHDNTLKQKQKYARYITVLSGQNKIKKSKINITFLSVIGFPATQHRY